MKSQFIIFLLTLSMVVTTVLNALAQPNLSVNIQNMHLWRGMEVADGGVVTTDLSLSDSMDRFTVGVWGGVNFDGSYKEFDYYFSYTNNRFKFSLWDTYNFSPGASYNNDDIFNYTADKSGRFLDATVSYTLSEKLPLALSWSTIIFGRDRGADNLKNIYSTYCAAEYPIYKCDKWLCKMGVGGAFALGSTTDGANFYGEKNGVVETSLKVTYDLEVGKHAMPISAYMMWNPQSGDGFMQLTAQVVSF